MADSDSTDGSRKIKAAQASGELKSLSRTAIEADVAAFFIEFESAGPIARLHKVILHRRQYFVWMKIFHMVQLPPPSSERGRAALCLFLV